MESLAHVVAGLLGHPRDVVVSDPEPAFAGVVGGEHQPDVDVVLSQDLAYVARRAVDALLHVCRIDPELSRRGGHELHQALRARSCFLLIAPAG